MNSNRILLIIPCFNEANRISIEEFQTNFDQYQTTDFLFVNDGSTDTTIEILTNFATHFENVKFLDCKENKGKAESIRRAVLNTDLDQYEYVGYLDADLATPVSEWQKLSHFIVQHPNYKFVMGIRHRRLGNTIERSDARHYLGRIFATIISAFILKVGVYDTQCGAKIIQKELAKDLFSKPFITKWIFDVELLLRLKNVSNLKEVYEYPLDIWIEKGESKIKFSDFILMPFQLLKLYFHYDKK